MAGLQYIGVNVYRMQRGVINGFVQQSAFIHSVGVCGDGWGFNLDVTVCINKICVCVSRLI